MALRANGANIACFRLSNGREGRRTVDKITYDRLRTDDDAGTSWDDFMALATDMELEIDSPLWREFPGTPWEVFMDIASDPTTSL